METLYSLGPRSLHPQAWGGQRESALTQEPGPNPTCLVSAKRRAATHLWTPSSFQPARPVRTHPAQSRNPRVSPLPPDPGGSPRPLAPGLSSAEATSHIVLLLPLKPTAQVLRHARHASSVRSHPWPAAQAFCGADTAHPLIQENSASSGLDQGFSVSTPPPLGARRPLFGAVLCTVGSSAWPLPTGCQEPIPQGKTPPRRPTESIHRWQD